MTTRRRTLLSVALAGLAVVLAGCQVRVATDIVVEVDGSGTVSVRIVVDDELLAAMDEADVDIREGLEDAAAGASWQVGTIDDDDATGIELTAAFATPAELSTRVAALSSALTEDDGALLRDVELTLTEDGGYAFTATAGIDPPAVVGSLPLDQDAAVTFDGEDLAKALAEAGDELARADLRVTFPTVPVVPADEGATIATTSATWKLPVDGLATVSATAPPLPIATTTVLLVASAIGAALLGAFAVRVARRRR